jgi:hypothetical protein
MGIKIFNTHIKGSMGWNALVGVLHERFEIVDTVFNVECKFNFMVARFDGLGIQLPTKGQMGGAGGELRLGKRCRFR